MRISDVSSDVCSSDLPHGVRRAHLAVERFRFVELQPVPARGRVRRVRHRRRRGRRGGDDLLRLCRLPRGLDRGRGNQERSEEHTSELQSLMRISYAVFCLKKKKSINIEKMIKHKYGYCETH